MTPVVFDLDGTLIDSLPNVTAATNALLAQLGLPEISSETAAGFVGWGEQVFLDKLIAHSRLSRHDRAKLMDSFINHYKRVGQQTRLMPGAEQAVTRLRESGVALALCTNKPRAALVPVLQATGMDNWFAVIHAGDDLPQRKPDPAPLHAVCQQLGVARCVYVGDSMIDAETAERAGMPFALYTEGIRTQPVEHIPHTAKFSDFADFPKVYESLR